MISREGLIYTPAYDGQRKCLCVFVLVFCLYVYVKYGCLTGAKNKYNTNSSRHLNTQTENTGFIKMADIKKAELKNISKEELAQVVSRYKARDKKSRAAAKQAAESLTADLVTVGSGAGLSYLMGMRLADAGAGATEDEIREKTQLFGAVDIDLAVSGAAAALGLTGMGGNMSEFLRNVGIGGLTSYAGRKAFFMAIEAKEEYSNNTPGNAWSSHNFGHFSKGGQKA